LLDEIDAALDEVNVGRFVQLLREFGRKSQFVVITHNKKTISCASTLLGVTMEESGITKMISAKLGQMPSRKTTRTRSRPKASFSRKRKWNWKKAGNCPREWTILPR
jgi:ABC-type lipoprotein export system ATPase subunit